MDTLIGTLVQLELRLQVFHAAVALDPVTRTAEVNIDLT